MSSSFYSLDSCYGLSGAHLVKLSEHVSLHVDVIDAWLTLQKAAKRAGFDLCIASAYRSFERQSGIWNAKLHGERPVLDEHACVVDMRCLSPLERIKKVMRWSAMPGASRHHWGSDMDIYDRSAIEDDYVLQLVPEEYQGDGPFAPMMQWLAVFLQENTELGFYFPYTEDKGGVMPEPWHLSYRPVAQTFQDIWNVSDLRAYLEGAAIAEKKAILDNLETLYQDFIASSIKPEDSV